jgi:hypothetical protein
MESIITSDTYKRYYGHFLVDKGIDLSIPVHLAMPFAIYLREQRILLDSMINETITVSEAGDLSCLSC